MAVHVRERTSLMWRRIAERVLPQDTLAGLFKVEWRIADPIIAPPVVPVTGITISVSRQLLNDTNPFRWHGRRWTWVRWPATSIDDLIIGTLGRRLAESL